MCIGAILSARISNLYFGAYDQTQGAVGSVYNLANHRDRPFSVNVYPEVLKEESEKLLKEFFKRVRKD